MRAEDSGMVLRGSGHGPDWWYSGHVSERWSWGAQFRQGEEKSQNTQSYWWKEEGSIGSLRKMALTSPTKNEGSEVFWGWQCVWNCWCKGLAGGWKHHRLQSSGEGPRHWLPPPKLGLAQALRVDWLVQQALPLSCRLAVKASLWPKHACGPYTSSLPVMWLNETCAFKECPIPRPFPLQLQH